MKDLFNNVTIKSTLAAKARTATEKGLGVNLAGYESAAVAVNAGTITDGSHVLTLQESMSDVDLNYTNVAAADLLGVLPTLAAANSNQVMKFGYRGAMQFLRVVSTITGATTGGVYSVTVVLANARHLPAS